MGTNLACHAGLLATVSEGGSPVLARVPGLEPCGSVRVNMVLRCIVAAPDKGLLREQIRFPAAGTVMFMCPLVPHAITS